MIIDLGPSATAIFVVKQPAILVDQRDVRIDKRLRSEADLELDVAFEDLGNRRLIDCRNERDVWIDVRVLNAVVDVTVDLCGDFLAAAWVTFFQCIQIIKRILRMRQAKLQQKQRGEQDLKERPQRHRRIPLRLSTQIVEDELLRGHIDIELHIECGHLRKSLGGQFIAHDDVRRSAQSVKVLYVIKLCRAKQLS